MELKNAWIRLVIGMTKPVERIPLDDILKFLLQTLRLYIVDIRSGLLVSTHYFVDVHIYTLPSWILLTHTYMTILRRVFWRGRRACTCKNRETRPQRFVHSSSIFFRLGSYSLLPPRPLQPRRHCKFKNPRSYHEPRLEPPDLDIRTK